MRALANHILYRAHAIDSPITHLQLQKVWYFTLGYIMYQGDLELAQSIFEHSNLEGWLYGPVVPELYDAYQDFRRTPIYDAGAVDPRFDVYNDMIDQLIHYNPFTLVDMSRTHTFWKENQTNIVEFGQRPAYHFKDLKAVFCR
ncbi:Panacea domain-containing protein [Staphylococcus simulans]